MSDIIQTELGSLVNFQRGYDLPKSEFIDGIYPVISSNGVLGYHNEYKVKGSGVTIGRSGTVGLPHFIDMDFFPHNTSLFIQDFKGNDKKYIFYLLKNLSLNQMGSGSGVPTLNRNHLHPLKVSAYIDVNQQQKISTVLSALDAKIELNNRINTQLETMAKTMYDYWFVQFDFPSEEDKPYKSSGGKMIYNEVLKREIPEGWKVKSFGAYAPCKGGYAFKSEWWSDKGLPVIKIKDINEDYTLNVSDFSYVEEDKYQKAKSFEAFAGDIIIAMTGATIGKFAIVPKYNNRILVNQRVGLFNLGSNPFEKLPFFINSMSQSYFREMVFLVCTGAAQPNISSEQINSIPLLFPAKNLISDYNDKFISFYRQIITRNYENQQLTELRDWLLPMLMNGQVKVS